MIVEIKNSKEKQAISRKVLEALTDWFGIEESREEYISGSADWTLFAVKEENEAIGFLCLKETGKATVELAVIKRPSQERRWPATGGKGERNCQIARI